MSEVELKDLEAERSRPVGYIRLVRENPNYRSLWLGEVVSLFGDWFNLIASASLVAVLTGSGLAVGGLFVVRMLAPFLVSPLAGVIADRYNRKTILVLSDLVRAVVVLGFLFVRSAQDTWLLYTLTALQLGISGFFFPARNAILPDIVSSRELGAANALSSATWSTMLAFGAAIGGLVAGELGIYPAFMIDSLSFLVSAAFISRIRYSPLPEEGHAAGPTAESSTDGRNPQGETSRLSLRPRNILEQYAAGLRYLRHHLDLLAISLHKGAVQLTVNGAFQVIQVALAERVFVMGEGGGTSLGLLLAVAGIGTGAGPILARRFTGDQEKPMRLVLALTYPLMALGVAVTAGLSSFSIVLLGTFLRAFASGTNWVFSTQLLLHGVSGPMRGRVFSTEFAFLTLTNAISTAIAGWALDRTGLGISGLLWWMAGLTLIPGVLWVGWMIQRKK